MSRRMGQRIAEVIVSQSVSGKALDATPALLQAGLDRADLPMLWNAALERGEHYEQRIVEQGYSPQAAVGAAFLHGVAIGVLAGADDA